jgi:phage repressor protein C with HTH and peptisase S24 domain
MEKSVKERIIAFLQYKNISKNAFEVACNMSKRYVSNIKGVPGSRIIKNINEAFPELNTAWLLTGEGEMLIDYSEKSSIDDFEESRAPILPTTVAGTPNIDILEYVQNNMQDVERSRIIVIDTPIDFWHIIRDDALAPTFRVGDKVALLAYEKGEESPVPGKIYAVDTKIYGLIIRRLIPCRNGGYLAKSLNEDKYPEFHLEDEDIIRIFRIVYLGRSII